jgi:hypothetical protein
MHFSSLTWLQPFSATVASLCGGRFTLRPISQLLAIRRLGDRVSDLITANTGFLVDLLQNPEP